MSKRNKRPGQVGGVKTQASVSGHGGPDPDAAPLGRPDRGQRPVAQDPLGLIFSTSARCLLVRRLIVHLLDPHGRVVVE